MEACDLLAPPQQQQHHKERSHSLQWQHCEGRCNDPHSQAEFALVMQAQGRQPHEEVRRFYTRHYSSNIMKGAVMGRQSLAELETLVRAKFGAVNNAGLQPAEFDGKHL